MSNRKRLGITLVELILVTAIIALLFALLAPANRRIRIHGSSPMPSFTSPGDVQVKDRDLSQPKNGIVPKTQP